MYSFLKNKRIKAKLFAISIIITAVIILIYSKHISFGVIKGIDLCVKTIIPSLFCFMIISNFIQKTKLLNILLFPFSKIIEKIFKLDVELFSIVLLSLVGGYPIGANLINNLIDEKKIDNKNAEKMLCYCVNCGPAFLIGAISIPIFNSINIGVYIYLSQVIACLIICVISGINKPVLKINQQQKENKTLVSICFVKSVNLAIKSMALICSYIILFCAIIEVIIQNGIVSNQNIILGFLEIGNGVNNLLNYNFNPIILSTIFTGFGGICVHIQIKAMFGSKKISMLHFYYYRLIYISISSLITFILFNFFYNETMNTISKSDINFQINNNYSLLASIFLIIMCILLLCSANIYDKINL